VGGAFSALAVTTNPKADSMMLNTASLPMSFLNLNILLLLISLF
jgi:hypothetical protein